MARTIRLRVGNLGPVPPPGFILGVTEPTAANTGLNVLGLTTANLRVIVGDFTINDAYVAANGPLIDRVWVQGFVNFTATTPVTISNSYLSARTFTGAAPREAVVRGRNGSAPLNALISLVNCKVAPIQPDVDVSCVAGERIGMTYRCDFSMGSDGVDWWNPCAPNARGCYFHDYSFWDDDPKHTSDGSHPGWSHNDMIQNSGSDGGVVWGNSFDIRAAVGVGNVSTLTAGGFANRNWGSAVALTPSNPITNAIVRDNWCRYGEVQIFLPFQTGGSANTGNSWQVFGNRHDYGVHAYGSSPNYNKQLIRWGALIGPQPDDVYGNVWLSDANVPVALRGTLLPAAILQGTLSSTGQYMVRYLSGSTP
jgi:hypothetical protein